MLKKRSVSLLDLGTKERKEVRNVIKVLQLVDLN